ncbi:hypothetical protein BBP40_003424 [Aspergillus hancockii]|nr:hypothetical protein BBP40_003424 [Aspergillus hancockii]
MWAFLNPQTQLNGFSVRRKIGKTICLSSNDAISHEVQKAYQSDNTLEASTKKIIRAMSDERQDIRAGESSPAALWPKLAEVLDLFDGGQGEGDDNEDYDEYQVYEEELYDEDDEVEYDNPEYDGFGSPCPDK